MKNVIPKKFNKIIAKINIKTNMAEIGDTIHISKSSYNEYISFNTRTGKQSIIFPNMIRTPEITTILEIIK